MVLPISSNGLIQNGQGINPAEFAPVGKKDSEKAQINLFKDMQTFVKLLVAQVKNQDPSDPLKTNEFTQQMVALASVEQAVKANTIHEKSYELQKTTQFNNASSILGTEVSYDGFSAEIQNGNGVSFNYNIAEDQDVSRTEIQILDGNGTIVKHLDGAANVGSHRIEWNARDEKGLICPDGSYRIIVKTYDKSGIELTKNHNTMSGIVSEVITGNGNTQYMVNGKTVSPSQVLSMRPSGIKGQMVDMGSELKNAKPELTEQIKQQIKQMMQQEEL